MFFPYAVADSETVNINKSVNVFLYICKSSDMVNLFNMKMIQKYYSIIIQRIDNNARVYLVKKLVKNQTGVSVSP